MPYNPMTGQRAKSNDSGSFTSFEVATMAAGDYSGIGIGIFSGICAIDLDDCVTDSGYYTQTAAEIIELMHSYTEASPSGHGVHILFRAEGFVYDTSRYYIMNHPQGVEVYVAGATSKYVTVTGQRVNDYPFGDRTQELKQLLECYMRRQDSGSVPVMADHCGRNGNNGANQNTRDEGENHGRNAINGANPQSTSSAEDEALLQKAFACRSGASFRRLWEGGFLQLSFPVGGGYGPFAGRWPSGQVGMGRAWTGCSVSPV